MTAATLVQNGILAPATAATTLAGAASPAITTTPQAVVPTAVPPAATTAASMAASSTATAMPNTASATALAAQAGNAGSAKSTSAVAETATPFVPAPAHRGATTAQAGAPQTFGKAQSPAGAVGGTVFALVFVLGLIFALAWLAKRMPGVGGSSHRALRVVASLSLAPREKIVVVDVGGKQLLLGVGAGGTRALLTLDAPLPDAERPTTPPFAQLLAQHFGKKA